MFRDKINRRKFLEKAGYTVGGVLGASALRTVAKAAAAKKKRPNIVLIMADDMGFSDIGCYGGEINTPNLDGLAEKGLRFVQFYNSARCCPSRASLLTGLYPHQTGIGHMTTSPGKDRQHDDKLPGYRGFLNRNCVTIAEVLREAGYHTLMSGKWHLGMMEKNQWPLQWGFDKFYGILSGGAHYFKPTPPGSTMLGNEPIEPEGDDFYITDAFTDYAVDFVTSASKTKRQPFFLYLCYTSPHWPLHAKDKDVARYRGKYMKGWDVLREERRGRMIKMGLLKKSWSLTDRDARAWNDLSDEKKQEMDHRMSIYAAQVDSMDQNIGRLIKTLKDTGELDNTLIFFLSDNGGCAEGGELGSGSASKLNDRNHKDVFMTYGRAWAQASNTPFKKYKHYVHEGGIATPLIIHWPQGVSERGGFRWQPAFLPDIMATCIDVSNAKYPKEFCGNSIPPIEGVSLMSAFEDKPLHRDGPLFWEHEGHQAVREKDWKLVCLKGEKWELYNLNEDRTEKYNLADKYPEKVEEMKNHWENWAERCRVLPRPPKFM